MIERQFDAKVKTLYIDQGGEYMSEMVTLSSKYNVQNIFKNLRNIENYAGDVTIILKDGKIKTWKFLLLLLIPPPIMVSQKGSI
ncbi:hypothetical protein DAMA08_013260 [Martiniozyma asiatica (nom. inval.)]|nr:hypothetical protein DAMA08_013260 [Martiniozyma asiatica]